VIVGFEEPTGRFLVDVSGNPGVDSTDDADSIRSVKIEHIDLVLDKPQKQHAEVDGGGNSGDPSVKVAGDPPVAPPTFQMRMQKAQLQISAKAAKLAETMQKAVQENKVS
jgi:hypothetical protein